MINAWYPHAIKLLHHTEKYSISNKAINMHSRGPTEQYFYIWEPHCGCLHKVKKVCWYPQLKRATAIRMAIGVLIEALLTGGGGAAMASCGETPPKDEKGLKEWIRNKFEALASLLGRLGIKAAEALTGFIRGIISWILNRAKDVVGWVSQNLWALVVGIGGLIYTYMVMRK